MTKILESIPAVIVLALMLLAYAACLSGCARFDRDPLQVYSIDPAAFGVPMTTFAVVPF